MQNPLVTLKGMKVKPEGKLLKNCFNVSLPLIGERIVVGCGDVAVSYTHLDVYKRQFVKLSMNSLNVMIFLGIYIKNAVIIPAKLPQTRA